MTVPTGNPVRAVRDGEAVLERHSAQCCICYSSARIAGVSPVPARFR